MGTRTVLAAQPVAPVVKIKVEPGTGLGKFFCVKKALAAGPSPVGGASDRGPSPGAVGGASSGRPSPAVGGASSRGPSETVVRVVVVLPKQCHTLDTYRLCNQSR